MVQHTCIIEGCEKPSRNKDSAAMCKMHYHRWYRHGRPDRVATRRSMRENSSQYVSMEVRGHPIAGASGRVYVHRKFLFDEIGPGSHPCHWCGRSVTWMLPVGHPDNLQVDHLNSIRDDNRLENLVISCPSCNVARGAQARSDRLRADGWWSNNDTIASSPSLSRRSRVA